MSGHPSLQPAGALCVLERSPEIVAAEAALERALVVTVAENRSGVGRSDVAAALRDRFGISDDEFSIHLRPDGEFLVCFADPVVRARVAERPVRARRFRLLSQPWGRSAGADPLSLRLCVDIEIRGIPEHGWHRATAEQLLSPFCYIDHLAPETCNGSDMAVFRLSACTPNAIPRTSEFFLPEPDAVWPDADPDRAERFAVHLLRWCKGIFFPQEFW